MYCKKDVLHSCRLQKHVVTLGFEWVIYGTIESFPIFDGWLPVLMSHFRVWIFWWLISDFGIFETSRTDFNFFETARTVFRVFETAKAVFQIFETSRVAFRYFRCSISLIINESFKFPFLMTHFRVFMTHFLFLMTHFRFLITHFWVSMTHFRFSMTHFRFSMTQWLISIWFILERQERGFVFLKRQDRLLFILKRQEHVSILWFWCLKLGGLMMNTAFNFGLMTEAWASRTCM